MKTVKEIQNAISEGKFVAFKGHNQGEQVTRFYIYRSILTIEAGNVRRFNINALPHFLRNAIIL